jgi:hypothetical protein
MVEGELRVGALVDRLPDYTMSAALDDAAAWLVYPSRSYVPQNVEVLIDFLRQQFRHGLPGDRPYGVRCGLVGALDKRAAVCYPTNQAVG